LQTRRDAKERSALEATPGGDCKGSLFEALYLLLQLTLCIVTGRCHHSLRRAVLLYSCTFFSLDAAICAQIANAYVCVCVCVCG